MRKLDPSKAEICNEFARHVRASYHTMTNAAAKFGVSIAFISKVCTGKSQPTPEMVSDMGYKKVVSYKKVSE